MRLSKFIALLVFVVCGSAISADNSIKPSDVKTGFDYPAFDDPSKIPEKFLKKHIGS